MQWLLLVKNSLDHFLSLQGVNGVQSEAFVCGYCGSKGKVLTITV